MDQDTLQVAGLQLNLQWESPHQNRQQIELLLPQITEKVDLIILPEMFTTGFSMNPQPFAEQIGGTTTSWMQKIAGRFNACVMGSLIVEASGKYFNRFLAVDSQGILAAYDKRHPFTMSGEDKQYQAGLDRIIFSYKGWRICPMICYDLRFPVWSRNVGHEPGTSVYDLLIYVANWPDKRAAHWECLLQARAIENQCFTVGVNRVGTDGYGLTYDGGTGIINPLGNWLAKQKDVAGIVQGEISFKFLSKIREALPFLKDSSGIKIFS